jgi:hypothetical protein
MNKWTIRGSLSEGIRGAGLSSGVPELLQQRPPGGILGNIASGRIQGPGGIDVG